MTNIQMTVTGLHVEGGHDYIVPTTVVGMTWGSGTDNHVEEGLALLRLNDLHLVPALQSLACRSYY